MAHLILIVDDEKDLVATLDYNLQREGFRTLCAYTGSAGLTFADSAKPDLIILDLMLPDLPGFEVCRRIRASPSIGEIPILMLTARGEEIDRVVGFEVGADDYIVKPFSTRELVLRVRAILRRKSDALSSDVPHVITGRVKMDPRAHRAWIDGHEISLTALEFRLLGIFVSRQGRVQTRDVLLSDVWGFASDVVSRTVDTHVKRLREKLGVCGHYIQTIRGVGYRFLPEGQEPSDEDDAPHD